MSAISANVCDQNSGQATAGSLKTIMSFFYFCFYLFLGQSRLLSAVNKTFPSIRLGGLDLVVLLLRQQQK